MFAAKALTVAQARLRPAPGPPGRPAPVQPHATVGAGGPPRGGGAEAGPVTCSIHAEWPQKVVLIS